MPRCELSCFKNVVVPAIQQFLFDSQLGVYFHQQLHEGALQILCYYLEELSVTGLRNGVIRPYSEEDYCIQKTSGAVVPPTLTRMVIDTSDQFGFERYLGKHLDQNGPSLPG